MQRRKGILYKYYRTISKFVRAVANSGDGVNRLPEGFDRGLRLYQDL